MPRRNEQGCVASLIVLTAAFLGACRSAPDTPRPIPTLRTWSDGPVKERILAFVDSVSDPSGESYVAPAKRIAVFDLDGTLIIESPLHLEVLVAMEKLRIAATADPSLAKLQPYQAVLAGDHDYIRRHGVALVHNSDRGRELAWPRLPSSDHLAIRHPERRHRVENLAPDPCLDFSVPPTLSLASLSPR